MIWGLANMPLAGARNRGGGARPNPGEEIAGGEGIGVGQQEGTERDLEVASGRAGAPARNSGRRRV